MLKVYSIKRNNGDHAVVTVNNNALSPELSQELRNHSPDGFEWGYSGSGCAQLALAILLDCTNKDIALRYYQPFKEYVIVNAPKEGFKINSDHVKAWIDGVSGAYYIHEAD